MRTDDASDGGARLLADPAVAEALRERVYATLTGISTVVILLGYAEETSPASAATSLAITMGGLWAASVVADVVAHSAVHGNPPDRTRWRRIARIAGQALETAVVPVLAIAMAGTGIWTVRTGLYIALVALVLTLVVIALAALRGTSLGVPGRIAVVLGELLLAGLVIVLKLIAH